MSYNILSQELLQDNAYLYRHCHPSVLQWDCRLPNLLAEIQQHNADVSGLDHQKDHQIVVARHRIENENGQKYVDTRLCDCDCSSQRCWMRFEAREALFSDKKVFGHAEAVFAFLKKKN